MGLNLTSALRKEWRLLSCLVHKPAKKSEICKVFSEYKYEYYFDKLRDWNMLDKLKGNYYVANETGMKHLMSMDFFKDHKNEQLNVEERDELKSVFEMLTSKDPEIVSLGCAMGEVLFLKLDKNAGGFPFDDYGYDVLVSYVKKMAEFIEDYSSIGTLTPHKLKNRGDDIGTIKFAMNIVAYTILYRAVAICKEKCK